MRKFWSLAVLVLVSSVGSLSARNESGLPVRYASLEAALQRRAAPGIRPHQVGGCGLFQDSVPTIALNTTIDSSIDTSSCPSTTPGNFDNQYFDTYAFTVTAGTKVHITGNSTFLDPIILLLTDDAQFPNELSVIEGDGSASIDFTFAVGGTYLITIASGIPNTTGPYSLLVATASTGPCAANSTTLCLQGGRFSLKVNWTDQHVNPATTGAGTAVSDTDQTGFFWFFSAQSVELVVKIVDGRALNGKFWVFYGALSDVEYTITVTDTQTGAVKTYHNPPGNISGGADTSAFGDSASILESSPLLNATTETERSASASIDPQIQAAAFDAETDSSRTDLVPTPCTPSAQQLCLLGSRFQVSVAWINQHPPGGTGVGTTIPATDQSGYFWFFDPASVELVVKMVDGTALNGKFWVFYGALSDVEYTITVTDTQTGAVKTYHNAPGNISGGDDTSAFGSSGG